jgi:GNAT superfamily N-acetyltransferase
MAKNANPTFFGIEDNGSIVCVNSVFVTDTGIFTYYRSRGLWVKPEYRKRGLAKSILIQCLEYARNNGGNWVWTVPRQSALKSYKNAGFVKKSDWFDDGQFGPNCIASKYL